MKSALTRDRLVSRGPRGRRGSAEGPVGRGSSGPTKNRSVIRHPTENLSEFEEFVLELELNSVVQNLFIYIFVVPSRILITCISHMILRANDIDSKFFVGCRKQRPVSLRQQLELAEDPTKSLRQNPTRTFGARSSRFEFPGEYCLSVSEDGAGFWRA